MKSAGSASPADFFSKHTASASDMPTITAIQKSFVASCQKIRVKLGKYLFACLSLLFHFIRIIH
jgi:molybdenum cofactor biosynthesis enzyme MoaA